MSNFNDYNNNQFQGDNTFGKNINDNLMNMAKTIDLDNLNGTNIMDLNKEPFGTSSIPSFNLPNNFPINSLPYNNLPSMNNLPTMNNLNNLNNFNNMSNFNSVEPMNQINSIPQDKNLIKSITKELINNLKENNISLHDDNTTYQTKNQYQDNDILNNYDSSNSIDNLDNLEKEKTKKTKKSNKYKDEIKKGVENMLSESGIPASENVSSYIFDDLFNLKEFIILFGVYFLLSQEMIKDLFAQYFTSLNPDDTGKVHVKGVIIYGLILTIFFMVLKKLI